MENLSFSKCLRVFCEESSLQGFAYMADKRLKLFERLFWVLINTITIISTSFYAVHLCYHYLENPTVISLESAYYPVNNIVFPAIAICNVNKMSRRNVYEFAGQLKKTSSYKNTQSIKQIVDDIKMLGHLYDYLDDIEERTLTRFQRILETSDTFYNFTFYDVTPRMKLLSPDCANLLNLCKWNGKEQNCSQMFDFRFNYEGFCCHFNYIREPTGQGPQQINSSEKNTINNKAREPLTVTSSGITHGLTVVVNNDLDDYFFSTLPTTGVVVQVFNPQDFPDKGSGGLSEIVVDVGVESFIELKADTIKTHEAVKSVPRTKRTCIFETESSTIFSNSYHFSDCFVECKVKSMVNLCDCVPFMIPLIDREKYRICSLTDIPCLSKYKRKWMTNFPHGTSENDGLWMEKHDAMYCDEICVPTCDATNYYISPSSCDLDANHHGNLDENSSIIHVFFPVNYSNLYRHDVVYTWFEMLSGLGGTFSLCMGFSIINVAEIIFFLVYRYFTCSH